jgi:SAM-dependent methyltransferase
LDRPDYYTSKPAEDHAVLEQGVARFRRVRAAIEKVRTSGNYSILDVGCAQGAHLTVYPGSVQKAGIEPSASARPRLQERGIRWLGEDISEVPAGATFDVVSCLDVLEHVEDPAELLTQMHRVLSPGGLMVIVTGNTQSFSARLSGRRWLYYALPEHCSFPSLQGIARQLVGNLGYEIVRTTWIANEDASFRYVARFAYGVGRELLWRVTRSPGRGSEFARDGSFPFFVDSNMVVIARKGAGPTMES